MRAGPYGDRMSHCRPTDEHVALPHYARSTLVAIAGLATLLATMLVGGTPAWASPMTVPVPTAKVDCVAFDATGRCEVAGVVYATTQVGALTYIGGSFTSVSGVPRSNVAAIRADGSLDPTWNPSTNGVVYALAASSDGAARSTSVAGSPPWAVRRAGSARGGDAGHRTARAGLDDGPEQPRPRPRGRCG